MTNAAVHSRPAAMGLDFEDHRAALRLAPDPTIRVKSFPGEASQPDHIVQFYQADEFLGEAVAQYIGAGFATGAPAIVIATGSHRARFRDHLSRHAFDLARAEAAGLYTELDAQETLALFMVAGLPDPGRFREVIGGRIAAIRERWPNQRLRAYGEMVDLLWRSGQRDAALRLEELWNELGHEQSFSLLCAYALSGFDRASDAAALEAVCHTHSQVIPTESYAGIAGSDERLREIALLQQRAVSLEHEVSRRRQLELELRDALERETVARAEAERAVRYNEMFAGMLGHDLRNPLNAILTNAHYISRSSADGKATAAATRIASSSLRMARMIEQLLDFTKIRVGDGLALQCAAVDLGELCGAIKSELEGTEPGCVITLAARGAVMGEFDSDRMMQVLSNVMGNAMHHRVAGTAITVEIDGTAPDQVVVQVNNAGVVAPEVVPVLFEPFRAVHKAQHTRGLGLGLYITRQIVSAHGGSIGVVSNDVDGTTFRIALPRPAPCLQN